MRTINRPSRSLVTNEGGMVAIIVTMVIMIIVTLVVSSFALIVRREQRQSLDRQLSTQAFYAAETGVNDAVGYLIKNPTIDVSSCTGPGSFPYAGYNGGILQDNVNYSCVLIDNTPSELQYTGIPAGESMTIPISRGLTRIEISWENVSGGSTFAGGGIASSLGLPQRQVDGSGNLLPESTLPTGLLEVAMARGFSSGSQNRDQLMANARTMYMYPNSSPATVQTIDYSNSGASRGVIESGNCDVNRRSDGRYACRVGINGLSTSSDYYLSLRSLYQASNVKIIGFNGNTRVDLLGAQSVVDVTGKAADVLRRIQVRVPSGPAATLRAFDQFRPRSAIETVDDLCKLLLISGSRFSDDCTGTPWVDTGQNTPGSSSVPWPPNNGGGGGGGSGAAQIGSCLPTEPNCGIDTGTSTERFIFSQSFLNVSQNPAGTVAGCTWDWGYFRADGSRATQNYSPSQCEYGDRVSHVFPDTSEQIDDTNGAQGCRRYTVTLTMHFTSQSGYPDDTDVYQTLLPRGMANDVPGGICHNRWRNYP